MITRLRLRNFCQFPALDWAPVAGLNGIIGRNGTGKSTILAAIQLALTGSSPTVGVKDEDVRVGTPTRGSASVQLDLTHRGRTLEICRMLQGGRTSLTVDGGTPIFGDKAVNAELVELLGGNLAMLPECVFIRQGRIASFITARPEDRARLFALLFDTRAADRLWRMLGEELTAIRPPARSGQIDQLRLEVAAHAAELDRLRNERDELADVKGYRSEDDPRVALVRQWEQYRAARTEVRTLAARMEETSRQGAEAEERRDACLAETRGLREAYREAADDAEMARAALKGWKAHRRHREALETFREGRKTLRAEKAKNPPPEPPADYADWNEETISYAARLDVELRELKTFLSTFQDGTVECPTCGTPVTTLAARIVESQVRLVIVAPEVARLDDLQKRCREYEFQARQHERWSEWYDNQARTLRADKARLDLADAPPPFATEKDAWQVVNVEQELREALNDAEARLVSAERAHAAASARRQEIGENYATAQHRRKALRIDCGAAEAARVAVQATQVRLGRRQRLVGRIKELKRLVAAQQATLDALEAEAARGVAEAEYADLVRDLRGLFHRDSAPRILAQSYLEIAQVEMNELLEEFEVPFRVEAEENLDFRVAFRDGRVQPAARLSGGQQILLAVAFWVAINSLFTGDLGLLTLDEPTEFLDGRNIGCLEVALRRLRQLSESRGLQVLLVTHEQKLRRLFDSVLTL